MLSDGVMRYISSHISVSEHHVGSLKLVMLTVFTASANATYRELLFFAFPGELGSKYLSAPHWVECVFSISWVESNISRSIHLSQRRWKEEPEI